MASSAVANTLRTPCASTATGFSQKTCRPASTAAFRFVGRKCGGSAGITTSTAPLWISFFAGVEPEEAVIGRDGDFVRKLLLNDFQADLQPVAEGIGQCHNFAVLVGPQRVHGGAGSAPATADQADFQQVAAGGVGGAPPIDKLPAEAPAAAKAELVFRKSRRDDRSKAWVLCDGDMRTNPFSRMVGWEALGGHGNVDGGPAIRLGSPATNGEKCKLAHQ